MPMTVRELKEILNKVPDANLDIEVQVLCGECGEEDLSVDAASVYDDAVFLVEVSS